jgi:hypothetical protein
MATATRSRLTEGQRADRALTERDFQRQVTDLAAMLGWTWLHIRPAQTEHGWRTPISGPLGKGWPDLVLVSPMRRRTIAAELKRELGGDPTPDQAYVHSMLEAAGWTVRVWRPSDMTAGRIQSELAGGPR